MIQQVVTYVGQELFISWLRFCWRHRWPVTPVNVFINVSFMRSLKAFFTMRSSWCAPHLSTHIAMTFIWQSSACSLYTASHSRSTISCYTNELMSPGWCKYQTDDRTSTAHLSPHLSMDYMLKLQGHTSMSNLIAMLWLYFVVLAWWFIVIILSAGSSAQKLQHFSTTSMLQNCVTCGWRGNLISGQIWTLNLGFDPKISLWPENLGFAGWE